MADSQRECSALKQEGKSRVGQRFQEIDDRLQTVSDCKHRSRFCSFAETGAANVPTRSESRKPDAESRKPDAGRRKPVSSTRVSAGNPTVLALSNVASAALCPHNPIMDFAQLFAGFFQSVACGSAAVFALIGIVGIRTPRRSPAMIPRKPSR